MKRKRIMIRREEEQENKSKRGRRGDKEKINDRGEKGKTDK